MRKAGLLSLTLAAGLTLSACSTYNEDRQLRRAAGGAAAGAAVGAGVGAVVGGVSPVEGAAVGAVAGGAIGAATSNNQRWYRDDRGNCFYVDSRGQRMYDYNRRC